MRLRHKKGAEDEIAVSPYCIHITDYIASNINENGTITFNNKKISETNFTDFFVNNNPIYIELGMGKGRFICENAKAYPHINFIGVEKYATVTLKAIENYKKYFCDKKLLTSCAYNNNLDEADKKNIIYGNCHNLKFICDNVENLLTYFPIHSIDKIFLNFSDPWPKKRHETRRLTHRNFLSIYEKLLKIDGTIEFKTDNKNLFNFSLEEIKSSNFSLLSCTYDLHSDPILNKNNIMTEYEEKWSSRGQHICKFILCRVPRITPLFSVCP